MGPQPTPGSPPGIILARGIGSNVYCVDNNRYVDLATGFGALLIGHQHPAILRALSLQSERLLQALGDVYPSDAKIGLAERLASFLPFAEPQFIFGQSGADAVTAALKTATLKTGRPGVIAFRGAYHGLSYGPLALTDLRTSYREPFAHQLSPHVRFVAYPQDPDQDASILAEFERHLETNVGAVVIEPIAGRAGVLPAHRDFLLELSARTKAHGALLIADEIWTGLGRAGSWLHSTALGVTPDLVCLGKGLGGGLPISACVGPAELMRAWSRDQEVVHTSTFAAAPLACTAALATLDELSRKGLIERSKSVGERFLNELSQALEEAPGFKVRGVGMMIGIDVPGPTGSASRLQKRLLERGYLTTTGGGARDVLVLTPALNVDETLLQAFTQTLREEVG